MLQNLQNKKGLVQNVFNQVYDRYDLMNDFMSLGIHRLWKKNLLNMMNPSPKQKLIDVSKRVKEEWKELDVNLAESESRKKEMLLTFPEEFQKLYDDLKNRGVQVIAAYKLEDNKCGCCGVELAQGEIDEISKSQYQQCPYCDGVVV